MLVVVPVDVLGHVNSRRAHVFKDLPEDVLALGHAPGVPDYDVISPHSRTVRGEFDVSLRDRLDELQRCELPTVIGVDDLRRAEPMDRLLDDLDRALGRKSFV